MSAVLPIQPDTRFRRYSASAGQTAFAIPFPFQQSDDVEVLLSVDGLYSVIDRSLFTVVGAGSLNGGSLLFNTGRQSGEILAVVGKAILDRLSSVVRDGRFSSKLIDDELDRNRIIQQEQQRDIDRSLKLSFGLSFSFIQDPKEGSSLVWQKNDLFWSLVNGPNAWDEVNRLDREISDRIQGDLNEEFERKAEDQAIRAEIASIVPTVTSLTARAEAAADEAEHFSSTAQDILEAANSGFQGFVDGVGYDFGFITQPMTYFNRDFGFITDPVSA